MLIAQVWGLHIPCRCVTEGLIGENNMRSVIFDLDGTLADTSGDLISAANVCFEGLGLGALLDPAQDAGTALRGGRAMLTLGFSRVEGFGEDEILRQYPILLEAYAKDIDTHTVMYDGAMDAVETLKSQGYGVGICTNKPEGLADQLLRDLGVRHVFGSLVGADTLPVRKPDPAPVLEAARLLGGDPKACILVGDSDTDRNTAKAAGVPSVLVTFGPAGGDMSALKPEALLNDFAALPSVVAALLPTAI
jgi:phosphoglycolate phosphatase